MKSEEKEIKPQIQISTLAKTPTPFRVTMPYDKMEFGATRLNKFHPLPQMEANFFMHPSPPSYFYIIKIVHALGAATSSLIYGMLRHLYAKEKQEAFTEKREPRCCPNFTLDETRTAIERLVCGGYLYQFRYIYRDDENSADEGQWVSLYKASANGVRAYKRIMEDKQIRFEESDAFMPLWDMFTNVHIAYMHNGFMRNPYLKKIQYGFIRKFKNGKQNFLISKRLVFNPNGKYAVDDENDVIVLLCSYTFNVNTNMVTEADHYDLVKKGIRGTLLAADEERLEHPAYILMCCDDMESVSEAVRIISETDSFGLQYVLFTTGNILFNRETATEPTSISGCFIRFNQETRRFRGVSEKDGYLFLHFPTDAEEDAVSEETGEIEATEK